VFNADHVVRLTGGCPLTDPEIIDATVNYYLKDDFDFVSNSITPIFPDRLDVVVFHMSVLE